MESRDSRYPCSICGTDAEAGVNVLTVSNMEQAPISENRRDSGTDGIDTLPEDANPFLWELGGLREMARTALATAQRTRNLVATASLLRSANGLLETVASWRRPRPRN
jgi:hypothetical protein